MEISLFLTCSFCIPEHFPGMKKLSLCLALLALLAISQAAQVFSSSELTARVSIEADDSMHPLNADDVVRNTHFLARYHVQNMAQKAQPFESWLGKACFLRLISHLYLLLSLLSALHFADYPC